MLQFIIKKLLLLHKQPRFKGYLAVCGSACHFRIEFCGQGFWHPDPVMPWYILFGLGPDRKIVNLWHGIIKNISPTPDRFWSGLGKLRVLGCPTGLYFRMALGIACSCSIYMIFSCAIFWSLYIMLVVMPNKNLTEFICMLKLHLSDMLNINDVQWDIFSCPKWIQNVTVKFSHSKSKMKLDNSRISMPGRGPWAPFFAFIQLIYCVIEWTAKSYHCTKLGLIGCSGYKENNRPFIFT